MTQEPRFATQVAELFREPPARLSLLCVCAENAGDPEVRDGGSTRMVEGPEWVYTCPECETRIEVEHG